MDILQLFPSFSRMPCLFSALCISINFSISLSMSDFFKIIFIHLFIFREGKGERDGEKHQCVVASHVPPTGDLACNPGMCPDWESNWRPFGSQANTQSTEPHQPGLRFFFKDCIKSRQINLTELTTVLSLPLH